MSRRAGTLALRAAAEMAGGYIALAEKQNQVARRHFEDGLDAYMAAGAPFEQGRARVLLAKTLMELGERQSAIDQARSAIRLFADLNAESESTRTQELMCRLSADSVLEEPSNKRIGGILSRREVEIIQLVANGMNNHIIAECLFISEHTVHRHLANILTKFNVNSRAAAVAHAAQRGLLKATS